MTNELSIPQDILDQQTQLTRDQEQYWGDLAKGADFISRIQLFTSNSQMVQSDKIGQGHYGKPISEDEVIDLGKEINCVPLAFMFKAMVFLDGEVITNYDPSSEEFQRIRAKADEPGMNGHTTGIEFLLFLTDTGEYVTYYLFSASARRIAPDIRALVGKHAKLGVRLAKNKKGQWHAPTISTCSTPPITVWDEDELRSVVEKFKNPPKDESPVESGEVDDQVR